MTTHGRRIFVFSHPRTACHLFFHLLSTHPVFEIVEPFCCAAAYVVGTEPQEARSREEWMDLLSMSEEDASKITWQGRIDDLQKGVAEAELNGKRALTMDHPHYLIAVSELQRHNIDVPGRESRPTPVIVDRELDIGPSYSSFNLRMIPVDHPNPTLIPDRFFFSFTPIIMIRHPARVIPSYLRAFQSLGYDISHPDFPVQAECFRLERLVFDSFKSFEEARAVAEGRKPNTPIVIHGDKLVLMTGS
ncbi:hypothetical protein E1B28_003507 [Marasmius oreades]|uniref:Uncharacterized protein n=1 Tax=Marasmius oreades TaxID=181124 RepID=A0A9P7UKP7_9AGAR|nr:uncharacterized protein E1B28_003507 [Marasmius oreades]KAG7085983.1 hypothetical protein E1B28_003507 [Marasmius oreades]